MQTNRIVITGADGFVGSEVAKLYLSKDFEVLALDVSIKPNRLPSHHLLRYECINLFTESNRLKKLLEDFRPNSFIHFAWDGSAGEKRCDYSLQLKNAELNVKCLEMAASAGCSRFVGAGSIMEYEVEAAMHANGLRPGLGYIYGMGKHIAHAMSKSVAAKLGIDFLWPMITNAYGVGELSPRFINATLRKIINHENLEFTSGTQNYDFVYVTDVAKAFFLVEQRGKDFNEYMIGSGKAAPLREFIVEMISACDPHAIPHFGDVPFTGINLPKSTFDITNLVEDCGFKPEISFREGIMKTYEWLKRIEA
ncbi:MAG: NAD-dependent epimerase/dehydratase family protein [Muribaculaceae bacterium]|nr:NAD-dependent epimerase/dehydratase family protein [Muribaculaceae bacterium]